MPAPFVTGLTLNEEKPLDPKEFPGCLKFTRDLNLKFESPVTFFVGENGSGKSTLLEAMAVQAGLPICGGGLNEVAGNHAFPEKSLLASSIRIGVKKQPADRYFFRAETQAHFASLLNQRRDDPDFWGDPFARYGGKNLHTKSHGEAFLAVIQNRFEEGLFFMDEPESALSPQRQLTLLALMHDLVKKGRSQFFAATHSPILLTYPGATILSFDQGELHRIELEETTHFRLTRDLLNNPERYWHYLTKDSAASSD